jgi:hypothetical protein
MEFCSSLSQSEIVDGDEQVMAVVFNKLGKWFWNIKFDSHTTALVQSQSPGGIRTMQIHTYLQSFFFSISGVGLGIYISNKFPGDIDVAGHILRITALGQKSSKHFL